MASLQQELKDSYRGIIEEWKVDLALRRIISFGFPEHDWDALLQELVIKMERFHYRGRESSGAAESTVIYSLITNYLIDALRRAYREEDRHQSLDTYLEMWGENCPALRLRDTTPVTVEVREAMASLEPRERAVCEGAFHGETVSDTARRLGCGWHTVSRARDRVRGRFDELGLRSWIEE